MIKKLLLLGLLAGAVGGGWYVFRTHPEVWSFVTTQAIVDALHGTLERTKEVVKQVGARVKAQDATMPAAGTATASARASTSSSRAAANASPEPPAYVAKNTVTLYLTNGGVVTGDLVEETPEQVTLRWEYGDVSFARHEIKRQVGGKAVEGDDIVLPASATDAGKWKHRHDVVFRLLNGTILDAALSRVTPTELVLVHQLESGGMMEQTIPREQLDEVMLNPVENERSKEIRAYLETTFPKMHLYDEGAMTIVTDSIAPSVKGYWRDVRQLTTDWYLTFYPLLKGRTLQRQQYLVIFDNWLDFIHYAQTDGVPGWAVGGYFSPEDEVLYLFNMMGEWFSNLLYEAFLGQARRSIDGAVDQATGTYGNRYEELFEGWGLELKRKFESADAIIRAGYRQITEETLRHELTHSLFHGFGLQTVVLSQATQDIQEEAKKKQAFLASTDVEKKRQLLMDLLNSEGQQPIEIRAANSWVVEGLAAYMERPPIGADHDDYLYLLQRARADKQVLPLEFLNAFRMGSFHGAASKARLYAYAQSWALVRFLMERYPEGMLAYLKAQADDPSRQAEEIEGLLAAVGKDIVSLNAEFVAYVEQLPQQDNPWLVQYQAFQDIFSRF